MSFYDGREPGTLWYEGIKRRSEKSGKEESEGILEEVEVDEKFSTCKSPESGSRGEKNKI